jgi:hypothetical protein
MEWAGSNSFKRCEHEIESSWMDGVNHIRVSIRCFSCLYRNAICSTVSPSDLPFASNVVNAKQGSGGLVKKILKGTIIT